MARMGWIGSAAVVLLGVASSAMAAPSSVPATATPTTATVGVATPVVVSSLITDTTFISANLLRTDATGRSLSIVGTLHDDGLNGDAVAGDRVFSYSVSVSQAATGKVYYRVSAAFRGVPLRVLSNVVAIDILPLKTTPQITLTLTPNPGTGGWSRVPVTAHYTCTPQGAPIVSCPTDQVFSTDGTNFVATGTATDGTGGTATATSAPFGIDRSAPSITVSLTPNVAPGAWTNQPVLAHFTCSDAGSGVAACPPDATLSTEGVNQSIAGTVSDLAGNTANASVAVSIDMTPPTIVADASPAPNSNGWNNGPVAVRFTCADALSGLAACPPDQTLSTDGFGQAVSGTVTDLAGNAAVGSASVNLDSTPPVLTLDAPPDGVTVFTPSLTASGVVFDALSGVTSVNCPGGPASLSLSLFSCGLSFTVGPNSLSISATDGAGNTSTVTRTLDYVRVPGIRITAPDSLSYFNISPTTVTGVVDDPTATVLVNSIPAPVANGLFTLALPLAEGPNVITATATAATGTVGSSSITVTLDTTAPHVTITSPPDQFVTTASSISVAGVINDLVVGTVNPLQARVTVNGAEAQVGNRTFLDADVPLALGSNVIQAVGTDRVGNTATTEITVVRTPATPGVARIQQVSGNNQSGPIGTILGAPVVVALADALGNPVPNASVLFKVTQNDGLLLGPGSPAPTVVATSDAQGQAAMQWQLGHRAGAGGNGVEVYAVGYEGTALFTASGLQGAAGQIVVDTGGDQVGAVGQPLAKPFIAVVVDEGNNRLGGVPVDFTVVGGGGSFDGQPSITVLSDSDGRVAATLILGAAEGNANNVVQATFASNQASPASFTASARTPGDPVQTVVSGVVLDNSDQPIAGVIVRAVLTNELHSNLQSVQNAIAAQTDALGAFSISAAPVGLVKLLVDGTTAQGPDVYPSLEYDLVTVAGTVNTVGQPIYLQALDTTNKVCVTDTTGGGTLTMPDAPGFSLTFGPGQVTFPGGSKTGCISVTSVHPDKVPMVPGFGQQPQFIVTIQPSGAVFNPPAAITLPNVDGLAPRAVTEMYSYDHDISAFVAIGTGVVSEDGLLVKSNPGVGVLKAGWHCGGDPTRTGGTTCPNVSADLGGPAALLASAQGATGASCPVRPPSGRRVDVYVNGTSSDDDDITLLNSAQPISVVLELHANSTRPAQVQLTILPAGAGILSQSMVSLVNGAPFAVTFTPLGRSQAPNDVTIAATIAGRQVGVGHLTVVDVKIPDHITANDPLLANLPDRIPPRVSTPILVTVEPNLQGSNQHVLLEPLGNGGNFGDFSVSPASIQQSGTAMILGLTQTAKDIQEPGKFASGLRLALKVHDEVAFSSPGFSVAAWPSALTFAGLGACNATAANAAICGGDYGLVVRADFESDSGAGNTLDLDAIQVQEQVQLDPQDPPSGVLVGGLLETSDQYADALGLGDRHVVSANAFTAGLAGSIATEQLWLFRDIRTGVEGRPVPRSGFRIRKQITVDSAGSGRLVLRVSKEGVDANFNGFTSLAGGTVPPAGIVEQEGPCAGGQTPVNGQCRLTVWVKSFIPYSSFGPLSLVDPSIIDPLTLLDPLNVLHSPIDLYGVGDARSFSNNRGASSRGFHLVQVDLPSMTSTEFAFVSGSTITDSSTGATITTAPPATSGMQPVIAIRRGDLIDLHFQDSARSGFQVLPSIDLDLTISVDLKNHACQASGVHDGFPAYEAYVEVDNGQGTPCYTFDPGPIVNWPSLMWHLFPPMDVSVSGHWVPLP